MTRPLQMHRGAAMVEAPDWARELLARARSRPAVDRLMTRLEREAEEMREYAYSRWPVSTRRGRRPERSRDALESGVRWVPPHVVEAYLRIRPGSAAEEYAYLIRSAQVVEHRRGSPVVAYMQRPARRRAARLRRELAADLVDVLEGR